MSETNIPEAGNDWDAEVNRILHGDPSKLAPQGVLYASGDPVRESCDNPFGRSAAKRREATHGRA